MALGERNKREKQPLLQLLGISTLRNMIHEKYNTEHEPLLTENVVNTKQEYMKLVYAQMFLNAYENISLGI